MTHYMLQLLTGNKIHLAPISEHPQRILNISTGTGIWDIERVESLVVASAHISDVPCLATLFIVSLSHEECVLLSGSHGLLRC